MQNGPTHSALPPLTRILAGSAHATLILVFRVSDIRRARKILPQRVVRALERRAVDAFTSAGSGLRSADIIAHEIGSDDFIVLLRNVRDPNADVPDPKQSRSILRRLERTVGRYAPLELESGWTYVMDLRTFDDLRRRIDEALDRSARERERLEFFSLVGHEMRTPLSSIVGYLDDLLGTQGLGPKERAALEIVRHESGRLIRIVDGLLDLSLLDFSNPSLRNAQTDLEGVLWAAKDATQILARGRNVTIAVTELNSGPVRIAATVAEQLFVNVLENAVKHGRSGGRVEISAHVVGKVACVHVDDDGQGIPAADRERVFEKHVRATTARGAGRGLGLSFVRTAVERAGGDVFVEDSPLGGARFVVRLPLSGEAPESAEHLMRCTEMLVV